MCSTRGDWKVDGELEVRGDVVAFVQRHEIDVGPDDVFVNGAVLVHGDVTAFSLSSTAVQGNVYATGDVAAFLGRPLRP